MIGKICKLIDYDSSTFVTSDEYSYDSQKHDINISNAKYYSSNFDDLLRKIDIENKYRQGTNQLFNFAIQDNCDSEKGLQLFFIIPDRLKKIHICELRWELSEFRTYLRPMGQVIVNTTSTTEPMLTLSTLSGGHLSTEAGGGSVAVAAAGAGNGNSDPAENVLMQTPLRESTTRDDYEHSHYYYLASAEHTHIVNPTLHRHNLLTPTHAHQIQPHNHNFALNQHSHKCSLSHSHTIKLGVRLTQNGYDKARACRIIANNQPFGEFTTAGKINISNIKTGINNVIIKTIDVGGSKNYMYCKMNITIGGWLSNANDV